MIIAACFKLTVKHESDAPGINGSNRTVFFLGIQLLL